MLLMLGSCYKGVKVFGESLNKTTPNSLTPSFHPSPLANSNHLNELSYNRRSW